MEYLEEKGSKCVESFEITTKGGMGVFEVLYGLKFLGHPPRQSYADFEPGTNKIFDELKTLVEKLEISGNTDLFAFRSESMKTIFYEKFIALPKEFKFLKNGSGRIGLDTKIMLAFDLLFPFNTQNHDDRNCFTVKDLSRFYRFKGEV